MNKSKLSFLSILSVMIIMVMVGCDSPTQSPIADASEIQKVSPMQTAHSGNGSVVYVDANTTSTTEDGSSSNPFDTIQEGIDHANPDNTVQVANGTYSGFTVDSDITVAATGNAIVEASQQGQVVITGDGATISGFTLEGNYEPWGPNTYPGGGDNFTPVSTTGSVFDNAVIYANADNITISSVQVNIEGYDPAVIGMVLRGDGIIVNNSTLTVPNGYHGGPIIEFTEGSDVTIENNAFAENIGGFVGANQTVVVQDNDFTGSDRTIGFTGSGWAPIPTSASLTVENNGLVAQVGPSSHENGWFYASDNIQDVISNTATGGTVAMTGNASISEEIDINKSIIFDGNGNIIDADFSKTDNSNNSAIGIIGTSDVTVRNLILTASGDKPWPKQLHGVNVYEATGVSLENLDISGFEGSGVVVNSSTVDVSNITTSDNGWHAINVDQKTSEPAVLTVSGTSSHGETYPPTPHIYVDAISRKVTVNDVEGQYGSEQFPNPEDQNLTARAYFLVPQTKDDCKKGGWKDFDFKNQGQCIQFVNTGK